MAAYPHRNESGNTFNRGILNLRNRKSITRLRGSCPSTRYQTWEYSDGLLLGKQCPQGKLLYAEDLHSVADLLVYSQEA